MKAVIAVPPVCDFYFSPARASALGAEALRRVLIAHDIDAVLYNFPILKKKSAEIPLPAELSYLKEYIIPGEHGPLSFFTRYSRFGPAMKNCAETITSDNPDIVFIACFAWAYAGEALELAAAVKQISPGLHIAAGGAGVSVNPAYFENAGVIDSVITGEAETAVPGFLQNRFGIKTEALTNLPSPGFYWKQTGLSVKKNIRHVSAVLSRGCPKNCRFCSNHLVHGRKFRKASVEDIERGINEIPDDLNIHLNFEDDNLLSDRDYFFGVLDIVKNRFPNASFSAENGLDYTLIDKNTVGELIACGFRSFNFSMASSDDRLLKQEHRASDLENLKAVIKTAGAAGAGCITYFICGLEGDTPYSTLNSLMLLHDLPSLTGISLFYPVPGLPGFSPAALASLPPRLTAGSSARAWTGSLSTGQLITAFRLARLSNLLKTVEGMISEKQGIQTQAAAQRQLAKTVKQTGRLHTLVNGKITPLPYQDDELTAGFIKRIQ